MSGTSYFDSEKTSDLRIRCGERLFSVHRVIICPQSEIPAFVALNLSVEPLTKETGEINLSEKNPRATEMMIHYIYSHSYDQARKASAKCEPSAKDIILAEAIVYETAKQYRVQQLMSAAKEELEKRLDKFWATLGFVQAGRILWDYKEYQDLGRVVEKILAAHIEGFFSLSESAHKLISNGMHEGRFTLTALLRLLQQQNKRVLAMVKTQLEEQSELVGKNWGLIG